VGRNDHNKKEQEKAPGKEGEGFKRWRLPREDWRSRLQHWGFCLCGQNFQSLVAAAVMLWVGARSVGQACLFRVEPDRREQGACTVRRSGQPVSKSSCAWERATQAETSTILQGRKSKESKTERCFGFW
jgi:hypothetical protein